MVIAKLPSGYKFTNLFPPQPKCSEEPRRGFLWGQGGLFGGMRSHSGDFIVDFNFDWRGVPSQPWTYLLLLWPNIGIRGPRIEQAVYEAFNLVEPHPTTNDLLAAVVVCALTACRERQVINQGLVQVFYFLEEPLAHWGHARFWRPRIGCSKHGTDKVVALPDVMHQLIYLIWVVGHLEVRGPDELSPHCTDLRKL